MNDVEQYETHEAWLARQRDLIAAADPEPDYWTGEPAPVVVPDLGKSRRDWAGEGQAAADTFERFATWFMTHLADAMATIWEGFLNAMRGFFRHSPAVILAVMVALFLTGYWLSTL